MPPDYDPPEPGNEDIGWLILLDRAALNVSLADKEETP